MEKAIDIKRRAQRCIQNGDLDGALKEYEKLIAVQDSDPYNFVLLADLLYKKGDMAGSAQRYVASIDQYQRATLYKNAIAVGKKMMRLSLSPTLVLQKLAELHALDGLGTEAALYYQQYAEHLLRDNRTTEAGDALRKAFEASPENIKALERLADVFILDGDNESAVRTLGEAAVHYQTSGLLQDADRCRVRASAAGGSPAFAADAPAAERPTLRASLPPMVPSANGDDAETPVGPPRLEVERSHMTSLSDSSPGFERLDLEGDEKKGEPEFPPMASVDINHSMEMAPTTDAEAPTGPPALGPAGDDEALEPAAPGLRFDAPAAAPPRTPEPVPAASAEEAPKPDSDTAMVEKLLRDAREMFRQGDREGAGRTLVGAARMYDEMGQFDNAAAIYRNLSRSPNAPAEVMTMWLKNCEARDDRVEAASVACELGDRALNDGRMDEARDWFRRASGLHAGNETAKRRLQKLGELGAPTAVEAAEGDGDGSGRVEVAVGRSEAVTFDLGSLVSEFQRGVETQISGDAQGHYDLGMAYREMGLLEQAIDAFRVAGKDPAFAQRCSEMVGRSMLDQGRFEEAAQEFIVALELPGLTPEGANDLRYQLGLAYEAAGRTEEALAEFERVYAGMPSYPDVAMKIRVLRKAMESS